MRLAIGDRVRRNPETWERSDLDSWGRGVGVGEVVEPPFSLDDGQVDVRWPGGRCFELVTQLMLADEESSAA